VPDRALHAPFRRVMKRPTSHMTEGRVIARTPEDVLFSVRVLVAAREKGGGRGRTERRRIQPSAVISSARSGRAPSISLVHAAFDRSLVSFFWTTQRNFQAGRSVKY